MSLRSRARKLHPSADQETGSQEGEGDLGDGGASEGRRAARGNRADDRCAASKHQGGGRARGKPVTGRIAIRPAP